MLFSYFLKEHNSEKGRYTLYKRMGCEHLVVELSTSNKMWKNDFFFISVECLENKGKPQISSIWQKAGKDLCFILNRYFTDSYYCYFAGSRELLNSPNSFDRTKKVLVIEKKYCSYKYLLTPNNLLQSGLWIEQGTLSVELFFVWKNISSIFPEGTDLLIPLSDSERHLAEVLLSQPEKMISTEEV